MNTATSIQIVRQAYDAVSAQDMRGLVSRMSRDVVWRVPEMPGVAFAGEWRGHSGVEQFFAHVARTQDVVEFQPEQFIAQDDAVVVLGRFVMLVKATGLTSRSDWAHVWTLSDGAIVRFQEYVDTATVRAAHASA
jgi:uncharacterized protein